MKRFCAVFLSLLLISLFLVGAPEVSAQEVVSLSLQPATLVVAPESEFTVTVILNSGQKPIDSAQVTLAFDPARLNVLSLTPGTALPDIFQQGHDNSQGRILYAAGKMLGDLPKGQLEVFKAQFRAVSAGADLIEFAADLPMSTKVASGGQTLALELAACQVTISGGSAIVATPTSAPTPIPQPSATTLPTQVAQANTPAPTTARTGYPGPHTATPGGQAATPTVQSVATRTAQPLPSFTVTRSPTRAPFPVETAVPKSAATQTPAPATPSRPPVATAVAPSPTAPPPVVAITPISDQLSANATPIAEEAEAAVAESRSTLSTILSVLAIIVIAAVVIAFAFVRRRWLAK